MLKTVEVELGPPNAAKISSDELDQLAAALRAWFGETVVRLVTSGDPTNYGATFSRRQRLDIEVPSTIEPAALIDLLRRELKAIGRDDLDPQLD